MPIPIEIPRDEIESFCRRHRIRELSLFGSVLRDDFGPDSDVDLLVTFDDEARHSALDHLRMERELASVLGRPVDLVEAAAVENPFVRRQILKRNLLIYADA